MALFVIGDLHLALGCDKPMDIFPGWEGYLPKLEAGWRAAITPQDTVVLAGDTSWAMSLDNIFEDFSYIQALPGRKILLKGNHDYWWSTRAKLEEYVERHGFDSIAFLHNNSFWVDGMAVCGTRGWVNDASGGHDQKIIEREAGRLELSLSSVEGEDGFGEKIVFTHYPPVSTNSFTGKFVDVMRRNGVKRCFYGHLHGESIRWAVQGEREGIAYRLVSADGLGFVPLQVMTKPHFQGGAPS